MVSRRFISISSSASTTAAPWRGIWPRLMCGQRLKSLVTENPVHLRKVKDQRSGLPLIRPAA